MTQFTRDLESIGLIRWGSGFVIKEDIMPRSFWLAKRAIVVEPMAGAIIDFVAEEAVQLSTELDCEVWFSFNDSLVRVKPNDAVEDVKARWVEGMQRGRAG